MTRWIICFSIVLQVLGLRAHQPDLSSTMLMEREDGTWIIQVRAALTAFEYEIIAQYGKDAYATPEIFKELVISHLSKNILITIDAADSITLGKPYVKLGHETNVVFGLNGIPKDFETIEVSNTSFKEISRNQSALIVLKNGFSKEQFILNKDNGHRIKLKCGDSKFIALTKNEKETSNVSAYIYGLMAGVVMLLISLLRMYFKKRKRKNELIQ